MTLSSVWSRILEFLKEYGYKAYVFLIPRKGDTRNQIFIKCGMLVALAVLIGSLVYIVSWGSETATERKIVDNTRKLWYDDTVTVEDKFAALIEQNPDFCAWVTVAGTKIDNPVYQTNDDDYYLTHNQLREESKYGAVFLSCMDTLDEERSDKNLVIYGHDTTDGSMFGTLHRMRKLNFYKQNPVINLSTRYEDAVYKIYAVMVLNGTVADDLYLYDITQDFFETPPDFNLWINEARQRSLINTTVDVLPDDEILSLVTCCYDFDNARLVVMARRVREGESAAVDTSSATENPSPRFPKRWYDDKKLPFNYTYPAHPISPLPPTTPDPNAPAVPNAPADPNAPVDPNAPTDPSTPADPNAPSTETPSASDPTTSDPSSEVPSTEETPSEPDSGESDNTGGEQPTEHAETPSSEG